MNRYLVTWSKTYRTSGEVIVEANSLLEAEEEVEEKIEYPLVIYPAGKSKCVSEYNETLVEATELRC